MGYRITFFLLLGLSLVLSTITTTQFSANVLISDKPGMQGNLKGTLYFDGSRMRIEYNLGPNEYVDFRNAYRYFTCESTCEAERIDYPPPRYSYKVEDTSIGIENIEGRLCSGYRQAKNLGGVDTYYVIANSLCRVIYEDGTTFTFTNHTVLPSVWYNPPDSCSPPLFTKRMDIELILDESSSIPESNFTLMKQFIKNIANSHTWGPDNVAMGLVLFSHDSRLVSPLGSNKETFLDRLKVVTSRSGNPPCITCGLDTAVQDIVANGRTIDPENVTRIFIIFTGGESIGNDDLASSIQNIKDNGIVTFTVGDDYYSERLKVIASNITGVQTVFSLSDYSQLPLILHSLTFDTRKEKPCGDDCKGFCSCGGQCVCPDSCEDGYICQNGTAGNGCYGSFWFRFPFSWSSEQAHCGLDSRMNEMNLDEHFPDVVGQSRQAHSIKETIGNHLRQGEEHNPLMLMLAGLKETGKYLVSQLISEALNQISQCIGRSDSVDQGEVECQHDRGVIEFQETALRNCTFVYEELFRIVPSAKQRGFVPLVIFNGIQSAPGFDTCLLEMINGAPGRAPVPLSRAIVIIIQGYDNPIYDEKELTEHLQTYGEDNLLYNSSMNSADTHHWLENLKKIAKVRVPELLADKLTLIPFSEHTSESLRQIFQRRFLDQFALSKLNLTDTTNKTELFNKMLEIVNAVKNNEMKSARNVALIGKQMANHFLATCSKIMRLETKELGLSYSKGNCFICTVGNSWVKIEEKDLLDSLDLQAL